MHSKNLPGLKPALTLADAVVVAALCRSPPYVAAGMVLNRCFWYGSEPAATLIQHELLKKSICSLKNTNILNWEVKRFFKKQYLILDDNKDRTIYLLHLLRLRNRIVGIDIRYLKKY